MLTRTREKAEVSSSSLILPSSTSSSPWISVRESRISRASLALGACSSRLSSADSVARRFFTRDWESKYSAVTSVLVEISDSTSTAMLRSRSTASSSRSAGTRTAMLPLKSS